MSLCAAWYASVLGKDTIAEFGDSKLNAEVRSPATVRRQVVMFGSIMPNRLSIKRMSDVWSNTWEFTQPPLLHGEMTIIGTRTPNPYGPASYVVFPAKSSLVRSTFETPCARDSGGVGGTM